MMFFVGSGRSSYLDFVGQIDDGTIETLLAGARDAVPDVDGWRFYAVPGESPTGAVIETVARRLGLDCFREHEWLTWTVDLTDRAEAEALTRKKSLVRHENFFTRGGSLEVRHLQRAEEIAPELDAFFEQHIGRRAVTADPSVYTDPAERRFATRLVELGSNDGWVRFTRVDWDGRPIAFHFGSCYNGRYAWNEPTFDIDLARRSPGEVLLRQLLLAAIHEGARIFDFGTGDMPFKARFARSTPTFTWGLYPRSGLS